MLVCNKFDVVESLSGESTKNEFQGSFQRHHIHLTEPRVHLEENIINVDLKNLLLVYVYVFSGTLLAASSILNNLVSEFLA